MIFFYIQLKGHQKDSFRHHFIASIWCACPSRKSLPEVTMKLSLGWKGRPFQLTVELWFTRRLASFTLLLNLSKSKYLLPPGCPGVLITSRVYSQFQALKFMSHLWCLSLLVIDIHFEFYGFHFLETLWIHFLFFIPPILIYTTFLTSAVTINSYWPSKV